MKLIEIKCTNCGGRVILNEDKDKGTCESCGSEFIFQDEINNLNKQHEIEIQNALERIYDLIYLKKYLSAGNIIDEELIKYPYSGELYLAKLLCFVNKQSIEDLRTYGKDFSKNPYYVRALKFLKEERKAEVISICEENNKFCLSKK